MLCTMSGQLSEYLTVSPGRLGGLWTFRHPIKLLKRHKRAIQLVAELFLGALHYVTARGDTVEIKSQ
jgi:hypothetical protein